MSEPEYWLRGELPDHAMELQPVAHALLQARADVTALLSTASTEKLWRRPGAAAPAAFHVRHLAGSLDRLLTYARGEILSEAQMEALRAEREPRPEMTAQQLLELATAQLDTALAQVRATPAQSLNERRFVGRAQLPATVRGLLFHAAEHTTRHVGQLSTTLKALS